MPGLTKLFNIKASDLLVRALQHEGVKYIFGIPGEENLDFLESIRTSSIRLIVTRHEQSAGFMAATYGRLTGNPGVCLTTLGPGATNLVTPAAFAYLGAMPMLMITGHKPIKKNKQGKFQTINTVDIMRPVTKFTQQIVDVNRITGSVREAFRLATEERPGPVLLEVPEDVSQEVAKSAFLFPISHPYRPQAGHHVLDAACKHITSAKKPLLVLGAGANRKQISIALSYFVEKTGIPFINTQLAKGVTANNNGYIGTAALSSGDYVHLAIQAADLIINVGHDICEKPPFLMEHGKTVIHINFFSAAVDEIYFPQLEIIGDISENLKLLADKLKDTHYDFSQFEQIRTQLLEQIKNDSIDSKFPIIPQRLVADIRKVMPRDGIISLDNGMYKIWFARNYRTLEPNTLLLDNAFATMGAGLPSAITAGLLYPERKIMAICGDGGFMMNSQELETAIRLKLNMIVLILKDNAFGMIRWKQQAENFEDFGLTFGNPDFVMYAKSYGASGYRLTRTEDLVPLLESLIYDQKDGIHVVEIPIDYSENKKLLNIVRLND